LVSKDEDLRLALARVVIRSDPEHQPKDEVADGEEHRAMIQTRDTGSIDGFGPLPGFEPVTSGYEQEQEQDLRKTLDASNASRHGWTYLMLSTFVQTPRQATCGTVVHRTRQPTTSEQDRCGGKSFQHLLILDRGHLSYVLREMPRITTCID
jgi:hypothetical protein